MSNRASCTASFESRRADSNVGPFITGDIRGYVGRCAQVHRSAVSWTPWGGMVDLGTLGGSDSSAGALDSEATLNACEHISAVRKRGESRALRRGATLCARSRRSSGRAG